MNREKNLTSKMPGSSTTIQNPLHKRRIPMKSGHIKSFTHLSQFTSVQEFNESTKQALNLYGDHFTKKERIALFTLIQYSVKHFGICNARIDVLVAASNSDKTSLSRATFERMLRKAKSLHILPSILQSERKRAETLITSTSFTVLTERKALN